MSRSKDGLGTICKDCAAVAKGQVRALSCEGCGHEFVLWRAGRRHNAAPVFLCDDCHVLVKHCGGCETVKPRDEFFTRPSEGTGISQRCRECTRDGWYIRSKEERFSSLQGAKFGMSWGDYEAMRLAQGDRCAICGRPETRIDKRTGEPRALSIDHCHETGKIRALLCGCCNTSIGQMHDDVRRLQSAIDYLNKWAAINNN